jgi:Porin subfamily
MSKLRSVLLAGAAIAIVGQTAQAADLAEKAKTVQYVKICSLYGAGFYYIPSTDICIKIGGYLRAEADYNAGGTLTPAVGPGSANNRDNVNNRESNPLVQRTRFLWTFDTRQQTEYGIVRAYSRTGIQWTTGDTVNAGSGATAYIDRAFIQFGGLTAGRAVSFFDVYSFSTQSYQTNIIGSDSGGTGINLIAYTAELGQGLSSTVSVEEHTSRSKPVVNTIGTLGFLNLNAVNGLGTGTFTSQAGQTVPNLVGNLRLEQGWGAVQGSVALADVAASYYSKGTSAAAGGSALAIGGGAGGLSSLGHPEDKLGYALTLGTVINLPWAKGDTLGFQAVFAKGASAYAGQGQSSFNVVKGNTIGMGFVTDALYADVGSSLELTTAWSVTAGAEHHWNPNWRTSLYGGYENILYNRNATAEICAGLASGGAGSFANTGGFTPSNCSPDFSFWQVGSRTVWSPVPSLELGLDLLYNHINSGFTGPVQVAANGTVPTGLFNARDQ